jgi:hypothetical protein
MSHKWYQSSNGKVKVASVALPNRGHRPRDVTNWYQRSKGKVKVASVALPDQGHWSGDVTMHHFLGLEV